MRKYIRLPLYSGLWNSVLPLHMKVLLILCRWMNDDGIVEVTTWRRGNICDLLNMRSDKLRLVFSKLKSMYIIYPLTKNIYKISDIVFENNEEELY